MFSGITITCFTASYAIALALEVSRLWFQAKARNWLSRGVASAGWVAHTLFLITQARAQMSTHTVLPLSSWKDFCLLAAWVLISSYLGLSFRRPKLSLGVFLLPLVLALCGLAYLFQDATFPVRTAISYWRMIHGVALLIGTVGVTLGFATGVMHLVQSYRLKHKVPPNPRFNLPSLEWLQRFNRESLIVSTCLLAIGLLSGVILNIGAGSGIRESVSWTDPVVLSSGVLFIWLVVVLIFEAAYRPARAGRKVAYLTMASFVFLAMVLYFVLFFEHASASVSSSQPARYQPSPIVDSTAMRGVA